MSEDLPDSKIDRLKALAADLRKHADETADAHYMALMRGTADEIDARIAELERTALTARHLTPSR